MRNLFLVSASVFALSIGSAVAQQSTTVTDDSDGSTNTINQIASGTNSTITVDQKGNGADAPDFGLAPLGTNVYINQASTADSTIMVEQDGQGGTVGNSASIAQTVTATNAANGSSVEVFQKGEGNLTDIDQSANRAMIDLDQEGTDNKATITQMANGTFATVNQNGMMNMATVEQNAIDGIVNVTQDGDLNTASAIQMANAEGDIITITQTGNDGTTSVTQN